MNSEKVNRRDVNTNILNNIRCNSKSDKKKSVFYLYVFFCKDFLQTDLINKRCKKTFHPLLSPKLM